MTPTNESRANSGAGIGVDGMIENEEFPGSAKFPPWTLWAKWMMFLLVGYSVIGRSFGYLGIPPAKMFIGDLTLAAFIFLRPRQLFDRWVQALMAGGVLGPFGWVVLISLLYGIVEVIRGILEGFSPLTALQNLVFNVYPLYLFIGVWLGRRHPDFLLRYIQIFAWALCIYGPAYLFSLHSLIVPMPGSVDVNVFGQPSGGGFIILGLLCLDPKPSRFWLPMTFGAFTLLAGQVRAEWVGFAFALLIWGVLARKMTRVVMVGAGLAALLLLGFLVDFNIPAPPERGGSVSSREIVARGVSAIDPELARDYTGSENTSYYAGTIQWRETWWRAIWTNSQENKTLLLVGPGYGFMLKNLVSYLRQMDIRTPHNIFFYALGYSGWVGVVIFFALQATCASMLWRAYRLTGQPLGLAVWASSLLSAFFGNFFETPAGAIPLYLVLGLMIGPTLSSAAYPLRSRLFHLEHSSIAYTPEGI
jgi:hypothetical protein